MTHSPYNPPSGGHPGQTALMTGRAVFTDAYAVIPHGVMRDIVTSALPFWDGTRAWIIARPLSGFAETFAQYLMEVASGGGSEQPEPDPQACYAGGPGPFRYLLYKDVNRHPSLHVLGGRR